MKLTYFIADAHGFVKIGKSTRRKLRRRFGTLQIAHANTLTLLAVTTEPEAACHARFADLHVRGEWYRLEPELLGWLAVHGDFEPLSSYPRLKARKRMRAMSRPEILAIVDRAIREAR